MSPKFAEFLLCKVLGWTRTEPLIPEKKSVVLAAPHTSIWDFAIGYLYYRSLGGHLKVMIKKEAFVFPPVGWFLRSVGGFPIDRKNSGELIKSLIEEMNACEGEFHLVICPEGTRKPVRKWKMGYHTIATQTGLPLYLSHYDFKTKTVGRGQRFELTSDARGDTDRIQQVYEDMHLTGLHPENYITH